MKDSTVKEYVKSLSDSDLTYLFVRVSQQLPNDVCEVSEFISKNDEMNKFLTNSIDSFDFFDRFDALAEAINFEFIKRKNK